MALQKNAIPINFAKGLDTKTDPFQVAPGNFLSLENSIFSKAGQLQKRNGFGFEPALPDDSSTFLTTFNGNLTAIGTNLKALSSATGTWVNKGNIQPIQLNVQPIIRSNTNQSQADQAVAPNGLICTVFTDNVPSGSTTVPIYKYVITDSDTGQNIVAPTVIVPMIGTIAAAPRVFLLGNYFILLFAIVNAGVNELQYIAVNTAIPTTVTTAKSLTSQFISDTELNFDAAVANNSLYIAWNGNDAGGSIRMTYLTSTLLQSNVVEFPGYAATIMSVSIDTTPSLPIVYVSWYNSADSTAHTLAVNHLLNVVLAPTETASAVVADNITSSSNNAVCTIFYEVHNDYGYDTSIQTDYINKVSITQSGTVGPTTTIVRSVGLASKSFIINDVIYFLAIYNSIYQPTYFLIDQIGNVVGKLAYSNGGVYYTTGLPTATVNGDTVSIPYLIKDQIQAINKNLGISNAAGVYSQTGINTANFTLSTSDIVTAEIGGDLLITGGFLWQYDGYSPVEQGFHLWPDYVEVTPSATGGAMPAQEYFYQATYEWSDNQGNVYRSAPSLPVEATIVAGTPITFTSTFSSGVSSITVSSTTGLQVGQLITDTTVPTPIMFTSAFASGDVNLTVSSVTGLDVGDIISDVTTPTNIQAGTTITAISGNIITISLPTTGDSAASPGDTLQTETSETLSPNTYITSITGSIIGLSQPTTGSSSGMGGDVLETATTGSAVIYVPTLRLTYKIANPVKICIYRWSQAQQIFYQVTSIIVPILNNTAIDYISYTDTLADNQILGNNILYTTGGVLENIAAPATNVITLFNNRLFLVDAEDPNLLWFSKQVIEATPVEMSDLLTIYVSPTTSAQGSTGPTLAAAPLDDKLCLFKRDAIYYINGIGPDNTGENSQYSDAVFVTSTVGCSNQHSIVFMPQGLMFQSDKGIWLLGRDLQTSYIGAPVEKFTTGATVLSAVNIPGTNQVRFTLDSGITLMYDYFYGQWGTFTNIPAISSTLYQNLHTYVNSFGQVFQETPGAYIDGSAPVLMQFSTGWMNLAGLQGYERAYFFYMLGTYISAHKLNVTIAYDYNPSPSQSMIIVPDNGTPNWGGDANWGSNIAWGGIGNVEQWRVFFTQGKCQAFQINVQELFDTSSPLTPGAGFTMSGIDIVIGQKSGYPRLRASRQIS